MLQNKLRYFLLLCLTLLTSCGFHPQGQLQLSPQLHRIFVQAPDQYGYLVRSLQQSLKTSNVPLVSSSTEADTLLVILQDATSQNLLSVNGTQQTRQYNLIVTVIFQITDTKGRVIVTPQTLSESRVITIQSNQILGSSNEATLYYQQMRRVLANAIMNRLASKEITRMIDTSFYPTSGQKT